MQGLNKPKNNNCAFEDFGATCVKLDVLAAYQILSLMAWDI